MKKAILAFILVGLFLTGLVGLGAYIFNLSRQPLGRQLTLEARPSATAVLRREGTAVSTAPPATPSAEAVNSAHVCGQSGAYTVLILGSDAADMRGQPGSDLTRLVRIDFSHRKVAIFALPRGLWVDVGGLELQKPLVSKTALGMVYYEGYKRSVEVEEADRMIDGARASAQTILDNFEVATDHYVAVDLNQLPTLIDAIEGLPIDIPERTTDPWIGTVIEAGPQTLSGDQLVAYARAVPDTDFSRVQRNDLILEALRIRLLSPSVWVELPTLYSRFNKMFVTDLSPQQIFSLFCLLREVPREDIAMGQVAPEWTSPGPSDSLLWDEEKVASALRQLDLLP